MKKILYISAFPPNKMTAGQNYSRELLNELSAKYNVDIIYFSYPSHHLKISDKIKVIKEVRISNFIKIINSLFLFFLHPFFTRRFNVNVLRIIKRNALHYDILYFDFSQVFIYSLFVKHPFKCMYCHDVIFQKYRRRKMFHKLFLPLLFVTERLLIQSGNYIFCPSMKDKDLLKALYNTDAYVIDQYININQEIINKYNESNVEKKFILFGAWNRKENNEGLLWFIQNVYPYLKKDTEIEIIGQGMPEFIIKRIDQLNNIKYIGFVEDPAENIIGAQALIAPIFQGAGVKVKVLETLATGTPVIGTDIAFEGIELDGLNNALYLCNSSEEFIQKINEFPYWNIDMKKSIRNKFISQYPKRKFIDYIHKIKQ